MTIILLRYVLYHSSLYLIIQAPWQNWIEYNKIQNKTQYKILNIVFCLLGDCTSYLKCMVSILDNDPAPGSIDPNQAAQLATWTRSLINYVIFYADGPTQECFLLNDTFKNFFCIKYELYMGHHISENKITREECRFHSL